MFTHTKKFSVKQAFCFVVCMIWRTDYLGREYWLIPETKTNNITVNIFIIIEDN